MRLFIYRAAGVMFLLSLPVGVIAALGWVWLPGDICPKLLLTAIIAAFASGFLMSVLDD